MTDRKRPHSKAHRARLLKLAAFLDRRAAAIRRYTREHTPARRKPPA